MGSALKYPVYNIGTWGANWLDDNGTEWYVEASDIRDGRAPKTHVQERPTGTGAWRSQSYLSSHSFTVSGYGKAANLTQREAARDTLLGLFVNGGRQLLSYDSGTWVRTLLVELNGKPGFAVRRNKTGFNWQLPLLAAEGRWLDATVRTTPAASVASLSTDGLDWGSGGLDWSSGGLDWGISGAQSSVTVTNSGNVPVWPVYTITGPVTQPSLTDPVTGRQLLYSGTLLTGQTLTIDTSPDTRSVKLDGIDRFGFMLSAQWMAVPPKSSLSLQFGGLGTGQAWGTWQDAYM
jgi:hypothetical protein